MSKAVRTPPTRKPSHIVGLVALWLRQAPLSGSRYSGGQPPSSSGVAEAPVTAPSPALYDSPIKVKNNPIPAPQATLIEAGMIRASHWRIPRSERATKMKPSTKTAVMAVEYEMGPVPWTRGVCTKSVYVSHAIRTGNSLTADDLVCQICIQSHGWCDSNRKVCADAHEERSESGDCGCGSDEVTVDLQ